MSKQKHKPQPLPFKLRGVYHSPRLPVPVRLFLMTLSLAVIASAAVAFSLGYKVNWQARTLQQTGIIAVTSDMGIRAETYVNGVKEADRFPVRIPLLFPGTYRIEVKRDGYQPWEWRSYLKPNRVLAASHLVIVKNLDQMVPAKVSYVPQHGSTDGLEARYNELWINGVFVTRLSQQILSTQWYPDGTHVAYQAGPNLRLYDTQTGITLDLATLPDSKPIEFGFRDGGRTIAYQIGGETYAAALYEP